MTRRQSGKGYLGRAPCYLAVFSTDGEALEATDSFTRVMPSVARGLNAFLQQFKLSPSAQANLDSILSSRNLQIFGLHSDRRIWALRFCCDPREGIVSVQAQDIDDQYDEVLRKQLLLDLVEKTPDGIGIARDNQLGMWINDAMQEFLGVHSPEEIARRTISDVHPNGIDGQSVEEALRRARQEGHIQAETIVTDIHGKNPREVSQVIAAHHDELYDRFYYSTIIRDISRLKDTERALTEAQARLERLLELKDEHLNREKMAAIHSRDIWLSLVEQNNDLVVFSDAGAKILFTNQGFMPDRDIDLSDRSIYTLIAPADRMFMLEQFEALMAGDIGNINTEARVICPNGELRYCVILVNRLDSREGHHAATWIISDATESRENRERLMAQEKMAATGRMAARIAHEINNPLAAIRSSLEMVRLDTGTDHPAYEYLQLVDKELTRVSNIIRQMYGLYQPEQDRPRALDIMSIVSDCLTLLDSTLRQRNITVDRRGDTRVRAMASESGLRQILFNLLQNALDVTPAGGRILLQLATSGDRVTLQVVDQGPGIDEEKMESFFEPFFTTKDSYSGGGLGLGLSVSASLAKGMAGDLQLSNAPGGGACATLTLRGAEPAEQ